MGSISSRNNAGQYNLKLNPIIRKIVNMYIEIDPLHRYNAVLGYLKPIIYKTVNELLDIIDLERSKNPKYQKVLEKELYNDVMELLEKNIRF